MKTARLRCRDDGVTELEFTLQKRKQYEGNNERVCVITTRRSYMCVYTEEVANKSRHEELATRARYRSSTKAELDRSLVEVATHEFGLFPALVFIAVVMRHRRAQERFNDLCIWAAQRVSHSTARDSHSDIALI